MTEHRSFVPTNFSLRDIPGFFLAYVIVAAICVVVGLTLPVLPSFWGGILCGLGIGFFGALFLLHPSKRIDIARLQKPSAAVRAKCDDPKITLAEVVKMYCEETGASLDEGTTVLETYLADGEGNKS